MAKLRVPTVTSAQLKKKQNNSEAYPPRLSWQVDTDSWSKEKKREEYFKCKKDPVYWMKNYGVIRADEGGGKLPFDTYPFQDDLIRTMFLSDNLVINKSRQMGISTLVSAFCAWRALFFDDFEMVIIATKAETAKGFLEKIKLFYGYTPAWMKPAFTAWNKMSLNLSNNSKITVSTSAGDAGRSYSVNLLVIDEAAFIRNAKEIVTSASPAIMAQKGKIIALSTPNGPQGWFYSTCMQAAEFERLKKEHTKEEAEKESGTNFSLVTLHWWLHPKRDKEWYIKACRTLGNDRRMIAQEIECDFSASGDKVLDPEIIEWYRNDPRRKLGLKDGDDFDDILQELVSTYVADIFETYNIGDETAKMAFVENVLKAMKKGFSIYKTRDDVIGDVFIGVDVASGGGSDYSTAVVIDEQGNIIACFKEKVNTRIFSMLVYLIAKYYNDAALAIESNSYGLDVIQRISDEFGYHNVLHGLRESLRGFQTNTASRQIYVSRMIGVLTNEHEESRPVLSDPRFFEEILSFVWKNGKPQAESGCNDDLVMAYCIGVTALAMAKGRETALGIYSGKEDLKQVAPKIPSMMKDQIEKALHNREMAEQAGLLIGLNSEDPVYRRLQDQIEIWDKFGIQHGAGYLSAQKEKEKGDVNG